MIHYRSLTILISKPSVLLLVDQLGRILAEQKITNENMPMVQEQSTIQQSLNILLTQLLVSDLYAYWNGKSHYVNKWRPYTLFSGLFLFPILAFEFGNMRRV